MRRVSVSEAKAKLSELLRAAEDGETVLIVRHGRAVARLGPPSAWPEGVSESPVRQLDLEDLERRGVIRRAKAPPDPDLLDRPDLANPVPAGTLDALLDALDWSREDSWEREDPCPPEAAAPREDDK